MSTARLGIPIARSTMNELFRRAANKLEPLRAPLLDAIKKDFVVQVDETSFTMTQQKSKAFMWAFVGRNLTGYTFALTRGGEVPIEVLGDSTGAIVCDDYRGYDPLSKRGARLRCGCLAHARRKFFEAGDVPEAKEAMQLIGAMYAVEHEAERRGVVGTREHLALRREFSRVLFLHLLLLARALRGAQGPKTLLGRAARYTWNNQRELGRALRDVRLPLDNNRAENALRIVALGRKNFLFVHSKEAGNELALLYSLVVSCTRLGVNPVDYLADVLNRIDKTNAANYPELLPDRWQPQPAPVRDADAACFDTS
ncbi:MAG: IS66 family transposase [Polyangiaceae bacterium]|nr:IS66 family transposase [Polyangiaceae bacterium]